MCSNRLAFRRMAVLAASSGVLAAACSKPHVKAETPAAPVAVSSPAAVSLPQPQVTEASLAFSDFMPVAQVKAVYFAYNRSGLSGASKKTLRSNAAYLKAHPGAKVRVAGYCDPRGTVAYNLALGQRRANAVRDFYRGMGVAAGSIATISYGKSNLACSDATDACYAKCRKASSDVALPGQTAAAP